MGRLVKTKRKITELLPVCLTNNHTFATYRLPQQQSQTMIIQENPGINTIDGLFGLHSLEGFLVAPWINRDCCPMFLIKPDYVFTDTIDEEDFKKISKRTNPYVNGNVCTLPGEVDRLEYLAQINEIIDSIKFKKFEKAVLSRVKMIKGNYLDKISEIFNLLCENYPNAFIYVFKAGTHLWMGASPEPLAQIENGYFKTAAVAGTRPFQKEYQNLELWNKKERAEQEYVTEFIENVLEEFQIRDYRKSNAYIKKAGNLLHLRTDFELDISNLKERLGEFIDHLHPTSAICGMPMEITRDYIIKLEPHRREYYSGFLGPVGLNDTLALFVNLRCMKVMSDRLLLYVGGGITIDSNPDDEWEETEIKAETLLSVIHQIQDFN